MFLSNPTLFSFQLDYCILCHQQTLNMEIACPMVLSVALYFLNKPLHLLLHRLSSLAAITLSSQDTTALVPTSSSSVTRKRGGRLSRKTKFRRNQHTEMTASLDESSGILPLPTPKAKRFQFIRRRR